MKRPARLLLLLLVLAALLAGAVPAPAQPPPVVTAVEIDSPHRVPQARVREAIGDLVGRPRRRDVIRASLDRLHALGLFSAVRVEERAVPGGVVLRYLLERAPHVQALELDGDLGLPRVDLVEAARLAPGQPLPPGRLEHAREALLARYRSEGYLAAEVTARVRVDSATNGHEVTFQIRAGEQARVGALEVRGAEGERADLVRRAFGLRPGARYRERAARDGADAAERRLRQEGFPEARVSAEVLARRPEVNQVDLLLAVALGPAVRVELEGNTRLKDAALRERLTFALTGVVDEAEVQASARQIAAAYREQGHAFVEVATTLRREADELVARFAIMEGPRVSVEEIRLPDPLPVPADRLRARMETHTRGIIARGLFQQEALDRDVQALTRFLRDEGHPEARVGPAVVDFSEDRTRATVTMPIEAGPRVAVSRLDIAGARALERDVLAAALPLAPGVPWSEARVEEGRRVLARLYARRGFHGSEIDAVSARRDGLAEVTYRIREGEPTRIGRVLVRGLVRTREHVVLRELPFRADDPLNPEELIEAQRRLSALGLFERVEVEPLRPVPAPFTDVTVTIREGRPWHVAFGLGYSTFEGARGFIEAGHDNLFGTGRALALRLRLSERGDREEVIYREPYVLGTPWHGDASLFRERSEEIGFELERLGVIVAARRDLDVWLRGLRGVVRYEAARVDRFNVDPTLVEADVERGREIIATVTPELSLDRRDRPLDPTRGSFHLAALRTGSRLLGSDAEFLRARLETHWFFDWLPPTVVALSARVGLAGPLADTPALPIEERFFAGGATTVRGYRERRLGPLDAKGNPTGGNGLVVLNAEWRFPIWRWFGGALFFDTGAVTPEVGDLGPDALQSGVGAGLRLTTPVGPIRLDMGYPLDAAERQEQTVRFYITIGHPF